MLKRWYISNDTAYFTEEVSPDYADEDIPVWKESVESGSSQAHVADPLTATEKAQLMDLLKKFRTDQV